MTDSLKASGAAVAVSVGAAQSSPARVDAGAASNPAQTSSSGGVDESSKSGESSKSKDSTAAKLEPRQPLRLSIERAKDGVFVYTMTDPKSGRVVAVIPREEVISQGGLGGQLDMKA